MKSIPLDYARIQKRRPRWLIYGYVVDSLMACSFLMVGVVNRGGIALMFMVMLYGDFWDELGGIAFFAWVAYALLLTSFILRVVSDRVGVVLGLAAIVAFFVSWGLFASWAINVIDQFLYLSSPFVGLALLSLIRTIRLLRRPLP